MPTLLAFEGRPMALKEMLIVPSLTVPRPYASIPKQQTLTKAAVPAYARKEECDQAIVDFTEACRLNPANIVAR